MTGTHVSQLFLLELGADTLFPAAEIIIIIVIAVVFLGVIWFLLRRTGTMSDELSKEAKAKFDAIKPTAVRPSAQNQETPMKRFPPSSPIEPPGTPSAHLFRELQDVKIRVRQLSQEYAALRETETTVRSRLNILKTDLELQRGRLEEGVGEIRKINTSVREHDGRLQDLKQDVEQRLQEIKKQAERPNQPTNELPQHPATQLNPEPSTTRPTPPKQSQGGFLRRLFQHVTCSNCGRRLRSQDRYCDSCGQAAPTQTRK